MSLRPDNAYEIVQDYEEQFAYRLGREVLHKPETSVWMIVIPILFVHHMYRVNKYKTGVRSFANGIMAPRKKALNKAFEEISDQIPDETLPAEEYFPELDTLPDHDPGLLDRQVQVINIFKSHYRKLLSANGTTYAELLHEAYPTSQKYKEFIRKVNHGERDLNQYLAKNIHDSDESRQVVHRLQDQSIQLREEEIHFFYNQTGKKKRRKA